MSNYFSYPDPNVWYWIGNNVTNAILSAGNITAGSPLVLSSSLSGDSTQWQFFPSDDIYYMRNRGAGPGYGVGTVLGDAGNLIPGLHYAFAWNYQQWLVTDISDYFFTSNVGVANDSFLAASQGASYPFFSSAADLSEIWLLHSIAPTVTGHKFSYARA